MSKSTLSDFGKSVKSNSSKPDLHVPSDGNTEEYVKDNASYIQYSKHGGNYIPCGNTAKKLTPGVFKIGRMDNGLPIFEPSPVKSDEWLTFRDGLITDVTTEISNFWDRRDTFTEYGFMQRRGYMFYGPPGSGKTILLKQLMEKLVNDGGIVFLCDTSPSIITNGLKFFSSIEPKRNIICVFEDIDAIIDRYGESDLLALLDGEDSVDHVLNVASTNYPEKLDRRLIGRPRRFDRIIKIGYPEPDMRRYYFEQKLQITGEEVDKWVESTDSFTFAGMTELVISVKCLGNDFDEAVGRVRDLLDIKVHSDDFKIGGRVGFSD